MAAPKLPHLLVVDDEHFILSALQLYFESNNFRVSTASGGQEALQIFRNESDPVDVVILDLVMPGAHGLDLLKTFKQIDSAAQVIIATGCGSMGSAIEALRLGAFDFITKPFLDFDKDLMTAVRNALEIRRRMDVPARSSSGAPAGSAGGAPPGPERWLDVYEQLNGFAGTYVGKPPVPAVLHAVREILTGGFGADAAAVLVRDRGGSWSALHLWGFPSAADFSGAFAEVLQALPQVEHAEPVGPATLAGAFNHAAESLARASGSVLSLPGGWRKVLHVPLLGNRASDRALLMFYGASAVEDPEAAPLALLATILSPILSQLGSESREAHETCEPLRLEETEALEQG